MTIYQNFLSKNYRFRFSRLAVATLAYMLCIGCAGRHHALPPAEDYNATPTEDIPSGQAAAPVTLIPPSAPRWDASFYAEQLPSETPEDSQIWEKQPYETADDYIERISALIFGNEETLSIAERELERLTEKKEQTLGKISRLQEQNNKIKATFHSADKSSTEYIEEDEAPFVLYNVKKGDTLYSLAERYYGSGAMAARIQQWNAQWISDADKIIAGMTIALFFDPSTENGHDVLKNYITNLSITSPH